MAASTKSLQRWFTYAIVAAMVVSVVVWFASRETHPIRVAAGGSDSLYYQLMTAAVPLLERRTNRDVIVEVTEGSGDNRRRLLDGRADFALIQGDLLARHDDGANVDEIALIAPLFAEVVHVIARRDSGINTVGDLAGKNVYLGPRNSGSRMTAEHLLWYYGVRVVDAHGPPGAASLYETLGSPEIDAAIVTTGMQNEALRRILSEGEYRMVAVPEARGIAARNALLQPIELPAGVYSGDPSVPKSATPTLATTAFLAARRDVPDELVNEVLGVFFEENLRLDFPVLISRGEALDWSPVALHRNSHAYFHPVDRIGWLSSIMESLAATKELLFALGAGLYLVWRRYKRIKKREMEDALQAQKDHLDEFMQRTLQIEKAQMKCRDPVQLQEYLDDLTRTKLEALQEFTDEELRADQSFSIFLIQCANLMNKIQLKIIAFSRPGASGE